MSNFFDNSNHWDPIDPKKTGKPKVLPSYKPIPDEYGYFLFYYFIVGFGIGLLNMYLNTGLNKWFDIFVFYVFISNGILLWLEQRHGFMFSMLVHYVTFAKKHKSKEVQKLFVLFVIIFLYGVTIYSLYMSYDITSNNLVFWNGIKGLLLSMVVDVVSRILIEKYLLSNLRIR